MSRILSILSILAVLILVPFEATAHQQTTPAYSMDIIMDGSPVRTHAARGKTYIEALPGEEYSIRLRNHTPGRIAIALSVDGLNTIDAKTTTAGKASKWILEPHQTITIDGWQTTSSTARRFFFTTEEKSYGAWLGKVSDLGVITAAVFTEKKRDPAPIHKRENGKKRAPGQPEAEDDLAATGIGRKLGHQVQRVAFEAEPNPAAVINVRYEYRDALVRLGVLPREFVACEDPLTRRERARGFQDSGFAPDPYDPHCR